MGLLALGACEGPFVFVPRTELPIAVTSVTLDPPAAVVGQGDTLRLVVTLRGFRDTVLTGRPIAFGTTNTAVATVTDSGLVRGVGSGTAHIVASSEGHADTAVIQVAQFTITEVMAGGNHSCATVADGIVCWGYNRYGQTGTGRGPTVMIPTRVVGLSAAVPVAGGNHTCARRGATVLCWGWNVMGQLGNGFSSDTALPVAADLDTPLRMLTLGGLHTCGLTEEGIAICWGGNTEGQLGDSTFRNQLRPITTGGALRFRVLSAGGRHTCGLTVDSLPYCWGANDWGQIGDSTRTRRGVPTPVRGADRYVAIAAGRFHSCGLTAAGTARCWGLNTRRQLGAATTDSVSVVAVPVEGGHVFNQITTGGTHTCALQADGRAYCWGSNAWGQVGDSSSADVAAPTPVHGTERFVSIDTFGDHTCGMTTTGRALCWGLGLTGELGTGKLESSPVPVRVAGQQP